MTTLDPIHAAFASDAEKIAALRRIKAVATAALVLCVAVFATARSFQTQFPWLSFVAAFAEAAAIGGLADWYAVVALFRRPLGLPIPHTAIVPSNRDRIADNLGRFIEQNFLASGPVERKLREINFAGLLADWLARPGRSASLSRFVMQLAPQMIAALEQSGLRGFLASRVREQIERIELAPLAAGILTTLTEDRHHQRLFDELIRVLGRVLDDGEALDAMRDKIRSELPTLFNLMRADAYLLKKIVASASSLLDEVRDDPDHAMRHEFDRFVTGFIDRLRSSKTYAARTEQLKRDLMDRPELATLVDGLWAGLRDFVETDAAAPDSRIGNRLAELLVEIGRQLSRDEHVRAGINEGLVTALAAFVDNQKSGVSGFIAEQVKGWDLTQLTRLIEINIGRDLQYIRFNGMLIGGIAGLALHTADRLFLSP